MFLCHILVMAITYTLVMDTYSATSYSYIGGPKSSKLNISITAFNETRPADHPYAVLVLCMKSRNIYYASLCSGSILTKKWVLTAGHCIKRIHPLTEEEILLTQFVLYAGGMKQADLLYNKMPPGSQALWTDLAIVHPKKDEQYHDIAILRAVGRGFIFNNVVKMIKISLYPSYNKTYNKCHTTGFGRVEKGHVHRLDGVRKTQEVDVINYDQDCPCQAKVFEYLRYSNPRKYLICAKPKQGFGMCPGDSGAGLVCDGELHGVANFYSFLDYESCSELASAMMCRTKNSMAFFLNTCQYFSWLIPQVDPRPDYYPYISTKHKCWNTEVAFE